MQRSGRIAPKRRTSEEFQRIYGGADRVEWMQRQPCFVVALQLAVSRSCFGAVQVCHTVTGGMGRKADANTCVPGCVSHHADYDQHRKPFDDPEVRARVQRYAAEVDAAWLVALPHQRRTW
jgi:hypothetical protein